MAQAQSAKTATTIDMDSDDHGAAAAAERIVNSQINMYYGSCAVMAVEAWRMWNEFPDLHNSKAMTAPLYHFGNTIDDTLFEIGILMSHMVVSPVLDDAFILQNLFGRSQHQTSSSFLNVCLQSALMGRYSNYGYSACGNSLHYSSVPFCCNNAKLFADLAAYVARRRMNAF